MQIDISQLSQNSVVNPLTGYLLIDIRYNAESCAFSNLMNKLIFPNYIQYFSSNVINFTAIVFLHGSKCAQTYARTSADLLLVLALQSLLQLKALVWHVVMQKVKRRNAFLRTKAFILIASVFL